MNGRQLAGPATALAVSAGCFLAAFVSRGFLSPEVFVWSVGLAAFVPSIVVARSIDLRLSCRLRELGLEREKSVGVLFGVRPETDDVLASIRVQSRLCLAVGVLSACAAAGIISAAVFGALGT